MKKTLDPSDITIVVDTREQTPFDFRPLGIKTTSGKLDTGDYSISGLLNYCTVERKNLEDLLGCVGTHRERFERECQRLLSYPCRAIVVEATWNEIRGGSWRSKVKPEAVYGSLCGWMAQGIPIVMAGTREEGARFAARILFLAARRRWREFSHFASKVNE